MKRRPKYRITSRGSGTPPPPIPDLMLYHINSSSSWNPGTYAAPAGFTSIGFSSTVTNLDGQQSLMPIAGTLSSLHIRSRSNASDSTEQFTVYKNGVATALSAIVINGTKLGSDLVNTVAVAPDDLVSVYYVAGASGALNKIAIAIVFTPAP
jgi:hypothetical protein